MLSKGVQFYVYQGGSEFKVEVQHPTELGLGKATYTYAPPNTMLQAHLEISDIDVVPLRHGRFEWRAHQGKKELLHRYADISPLTGNLGASNMGVMLDTRSKVTPEYALSYGFYDAGEGVGGLTDKDQSYVYVTRNHARWMGDLVAANPRVGQRPFGTMVLPGAHDSGMFDPTTLDRLLGIPVFVAALGGLLAMGAAALPASVVRRAAIGLSFTQKDDVTTLLNLGVRFLDFRPGYCFMYLLPGIFHQHSMIPGYPYNRFLEDVFAWLLAHPTEIVVVNLGSSGFADDAMRPTVPVLRQAITDAQHHVGAGGIALGNRNDLATPLSVLLQQNKRLIFLNNKRGDDKKADDAHKDPDVASRYDSYSDGAYKTTNVNSIIRALEKMSAAEQPGHDYTVLQLQGTATGANLKAGAAGVLTLSDASSPLLSTKAAFDHATYRWVQACVPGRLLHDQLLVLLNDFADNALTEHAIALTSARAT